MYIWIFTRDIYIYIYISGKLMNVHHDFLTSCLMYKKWRKIVEMTYSASWVRIRYQNCDNSALKKVIGPQRPISWTNVPRVFYFFSNFSMRNYFFENSSVLKSLDITSTSVKISDVKVFSNSSKWWLLFPKIMIFQVFSRFRVSVRLGNKSQWPSKILLRTI